MLFPQKNITQFAGSYVDITDSTKIYGLQRLHRKDLYGPLSALKECNSLNGPLRLNLFYRSGFKFGQVMTAGALITVILAFTTSMPCVGNKTGHAYPNFGNASLSDCSKTIQATLYTIIHNLALPSFNESREAIDYYDYCPLSALKSGA